MSNFYFYNGVDLTSKQKVYAEIFTRRLHAFSNYGRMAQGITTAAITGQVEDE
jgi:hypothetical protein